MGKDSNLDPIAEEARRIQGGSFDFGFKATPVFELEDLDVPKERAEPFVITLEDPLRNASANQSIALIGMLQNIIDLFLSDARVNPFEVDATLKYLRKINKQKEHQGSSAN